jgi:hypothetical protein
MDYQDWLMHTILIINEDGYRVAELEDFDFYIAYKRGWGPDWAAEEFMNAVDRANGEPI